MNNKYIVLNSEEYETRFPKKGTSTLDNEQLDSYLNLYSFYHHLTLLYLTKQLPIVEFDQHFSNSALKYKEISIEKMDMYQKLSSPVLHYFYIRNNFYLDRLTLPERQYLENRMLEGNMELDATLMNVLHNSIPRVIVEEQVQGTNKKETNFGPISPRFFAPVNALVIGFRFDEFDYNGLSDQEWAILDDQRRKDIDLTLDTMGKRIREQTNMPFSLIQYDDFSVKKLPTAKVSQL